MLEARLHLLVYAKDLGVGLAHIHDVTDSASTEASAALLLLLINESFGRPVLILNDQE